MVGNPVSVNVDRVDRSECGGRPAGQCIGRVLMHQLIHHLPQVGPKMYMAGLLLRSSMVV